MSFDAKAYDATVLKPLNKDKARLTEIQRAIREIQESSNVATLAGLGLEELLAIPADHSDIAAHLRSVDSHLNKRENNSLAQLLQKLMKVLTAADVDLTAADFWSQLAAAKAVAYQAKVDEFAVAVAAEHQALKTITEEGLEEKARSQGLLPAVPMAKLASVVEAAGIAVRPDFEIPQVVVPRAVVDLSKHTEYRSVVDVLLLGEPTRPESIRVIDALSYGAGKRISPDHLLAASKAAESGKDSDALQAAQKALTLIRTDFPQPEDLHQLVLATFVSYAKEMTARGELLASALTRLSKDTGLDRVDAARLLAKLSGGASTRGLNDVTNLLAEGSLADARRTFDAVADPSQFEEDEINRVKGTLTAAEQRKAALVATYESAIKVKDYGAAANALNQAVGIDKQDARLQSLLEMLPPPAPEQLVAKQAPDGGVALSWSYGVGNDCRFVVVRNTDGHPPANPADGTQLVRDLATKSFVDSTAPAAQLIHYSVFVERRGVASLPVSAEQLVLPVPADATASASLTEITLMWRLAAQAVGVQIARINPDGTRVPVNVQGGNRVTVAGLVTGSRYRFQLEAIYVLRDGRRVVSPPATVDATPRGAIRAVTDLQVTDARLPDGRDGHQAIWTEPGGFSVELWSFPVDVVLPPVGSDVALDDLGSIDGRRVSGVLGHSGGRTALSFGKLPDLRVIAAVTVGDERGLFGSSAVAGSAPSVKNGRVDRYGDELVVSWEWPHGDYSAAVSWAGRGVSQSRRCTRAEYKADGGFRISAAMDVERVSIATVVFGNGAEWTSQPVEVQTPVPRSIVRYDLEIPPSRLGRRKPVRVQVHPNGYTGPLSIVAVIRTSSIMPSRADDGDVVTRLDLQLDGNNPVGAEFGIPKVQSPFWVRLFLVDDSKVKLDDPPTNQLKG